MRGCFASWCALNHTYCFRSALRAAAQRMCAGGAKRHARCRQPVRQRGAQQKQSKSAWQPRTVQQSKVEAQAWGVAPAGSPAWLAAPARCSALHRARLSTRRPLRQRPGQTHARQWQGTHGVAGHTRGGGQYPCCSFAARARLFSLVPAPSAEAPAPLARQDMQATTRAGMAAAAAEHRSWQRRAPLSSLLLPALHISTGRSHWLTPVAALK